MLNKKHYPEVNQDVYDAELTNGLKVTLIPMSHYNETYGILTVNYGSVDNQFIPIGQQKMIKFPAGIAHFLEHKMFEKSDHDAFDLFGKWGADSNAYTSYTQTSYQFTTTSNIIENLQILLNFVQTPYFTQAGVAKEQGIIGQEIRMYHDNPDARLYNGIVSGLYPNDPIGIDIAGTEDSIKKITAEMLMECYRTFYQPANMKLVLAGKMDVQQIFEFIDQNQSNKDLHNYEIRRAKLVHDAAGEDIKTHQKIKMNVNRPKAIIGIRGIANFNDSEELLKYKLACELLLEMLFDDTSNDYLSLYRNSIIDDSFGFSFDMERGFHFATISTDTDQPDFFIKKFAPFYCQHLKKFNRCKINLLTLKEGL